MSERAQGRKGVAWIEIAILLVAIAVGFGAGIADQSYGAFVIFGCLTLLGLSITHYIVASMMGTPKPCWGNILWDVINWIT